MRETFREAAAKLCDDYAEFVKNTSHRDGLGMGDLGAENLCRNLAARIRALPAPEPVAVEREEIVTITLACIEEADRVHRTKYQLADEVATALLALYRAARKEAP